MPTLYESYTINDDQYNYAYGDATGRKLSQGFTPSVSHSITSVKLYGIKEGASIGTITVYIYAASGGLPTGAALCSGTYDGSLLSDSVPAWFEITFGSPSNLSASTQYCIVVAALTAPVNHAFKPRCDDSSPSYSGGDLAANDDGAGWVSFGAGARDMLFEEYGNLSTNIKTVNGLAQASVKTWNNLAISSVKSINGLQ